MGLLSDAKKIASRDPAARGVVGVIFMYPGFHALVHHKFSYFLYKHKLFAWARLHSQFARLCTGIEIHPGAKIGQGLFIDHGMGVVIGETAIIGDDCTIYHNVTLGGRGHAKGKKRHPTLGSNVLVGAGAKILGDVTIGDNANIGANAVVLHDVPPDATVVGVPGKVVRVNGKPSNDNKKVSHAVELDHTLAPDPLGQEVCKILHRLKKLEDELSQIKSEDSIDTNDNN